MTILEWHTNYTEAVWSSMNDRQKAVAYGELLKCLYNEFTAHPFSTDPAALAIHRSLQDSIKATQKAIHDHMADSISGQTTSPTK